MTELRMTVGGLRKRARIFKDICPLRPCSRGEVLHTLYAPESSVYFEQLSCTFMETSMSRRLSGLAAVDRHSILNCFHLATPRRAVSGGISVCGATMEQHDWRGWVAVEQRATEASGRATE